jgi:hypothetical protein
MKKPDDDSLRGSGLFIGSDPIQSVRYKSAGKDDDGDKGDDDSTDTDSTDTDATDSKDADGKD